MSAVNLTIRGQKLEFDDTDSPEEVRRKLREQSPSLYREVVLGQAPTMEEHARRSRIQGAQDVVQDVGPVRAAVLGAGETGSRIATGVKTLFGGDRPSEADVESERAMMESVREQQPVASFLGAAAPYAAIPMGATAGLAGRGVGALGRRLGSEAMGTAGQRLAQSAVADAALIGAGTGAIENYEDRAMGALTGGIMGAGGTWAANRLFAPRPTNVNPAAEAAAEQGFRLSPSERYARSPSVEKFERALETWPFVRASGGRKIRERNQRMLDAQLRDALGLPTGSPLTKSALSKLKGRFEDAFAYPLEVTRDLQSRLGRIAARETDLTARVPPQREVIRSAVNKMGRREISPDTVRQVLVDLNRASMKSDLNGAARQAIRDAREEILKEVGAQAGDVAERAIRTNLERYGLATAAQKFRTKDGPIDYRRILTDFYRNQSGRTVPSPTGFRGLLETGEPFERHALGIVRDDLTPESGFSQFLRNPLSGGALAGAVGGFPAAVAGAVTPLAIAAGHYSGAIPRAVDRGLLGALIPGQMPGALSPIAQRAGRTLGLMAAGQ